MKILLVGYGNVNRIIYRQNQESVVGIIGLNNEYVTAVPDVIIDFSHSNMLDKTIYYATKYNIPVVFGTTGYDAENMARIKELSKIVPVLKNENFSSGIHMIKKIITNNKKQLATYDKEIVEIHHKDKKDSPSGTALMLANMLDTTNIQSIREGNVVGVHELIFRNENEEISIIHRMKSRISFAEEAVMCARWLLNKLPGYYKYEDFFEFRI